MADTPHPSAGSEPSGPLVGVLALQGSFELHLGALESSGARTRRVRAPNDLQGIDALVLPGGESTTLARLAEDYALFEPLRELGREGVPMLGTCAGAILLGRGVERPRRLELVDLSVERNAYGRQVDSFSAEVELSFSDAPFHAVFIRAPRFRVPDPSGSLEVLGRHGRDPVLVRQGTFLLSAFHPELTRDLRVHRFFLEEVVAAR